MRARLITAAVLGACLAAAPAHAAVTQPPQPKSGPGGSAYTHGGVRETPGGVGADAWFAFEPVKPRPKKAPLVILTHGYYEFEGHKQFDDAIQHLVRKGNIVIYPRYQTDIVTACPGPFDIEPCLQSTRKGIRDALTFLRASTTRVQPQTSKTIYIGFSFGGIITANITNRYKSLGLPKPRAIFLEDPHDGGLVPNAVEPAVDDSLAGIPASTKVQCHSSEDGATGDPTKADFSCNAIFPKLGHIPAKNKDLVLIRADDHGSPPLTAPHGVCSSEQGQANAYDWNFCWKVWDALGSCVYEREDCEYALGDTRRHRSNGRWSDGVAVKPLTIQDRAPIRP